LGTGKNSADEFIDFMRELIEDLKKHNSTYDFLVNGKVVFILDNASFHRSKSVVKFFETHRLNVMYLPSYSPELNAAECHFNSLKKNFYQNLFSDL
jgi:hypothetical protein